MFREVITETMKATDLHTLQYLSAVRVAISVCESEDVQYMIRECRNAVGTGIVGFTENMWDTFNANVRRMLVRIGVFDIIIDIILENLWLVSFEISKWILYHFKETGIDCSSKFFWTPHLKIDYLETAKMLIKKNTLDVKNRFKLACFYCLESEVRSLWKQMNLSEKRSFFIRRKPTKSYQNPIVLYWTYYIQEVPIDFWKRKTLDQKYLFKFAVKKGYLCATKYFFGEFKVQFRKMMMSGCFRVHLNGLNNRQYASRDHFSIACFFICQFPLYHQEIRSFWALHLVFRYFLEWPMQKHFITIVNRLRNFLSEYIYAKLLEAIFEKDFGGFEDYDYKGLFMELWLQMPANCKSFVNSTPDHGYTIFLRFVKKHFGFVFVESSFELKTKFRAAVFQQDIPDNLTTFDKKSIEFFKFLVRERVATKTNIQNNRYSYLAYGFSSVKLPFGELFYLMDVILGTEIPLL